ncbi:ABC transporter permease [Microbacterium sp. BWT-B31]|uniref:ABC transporter permease n=1 Tax=Microbacterium sp. BWT-B31 TaxID=3232072 RepID=UPI003527A1A6
MNAKTTKILPWVTTPILLIVIIAVWQVIVTAFNVNALVFPSPGAVGESMLRLLGTSELWVNAGYTALETVVGFLIAVVVGVILGVVLGKMFWLEVSLRPFIIVTQVVPKVAFIPLFVMWFGFGMNSKIVLAFILAFFPVMMNVLLGVRSVEQGHREVLKSLGASRWQTFTQMEVRSLMPYLFAGMEVAIVLATIGAIVAEYMSGTTGLGFMLISSLNGGDAAGMFAIIVFLSILGLVLYFLVSGSKRFVIPWHESVYGQQVQGV